MGGVPRISGRRMSAGRATEVRQQYEGSEVEITGHRAPSSCGGLFCEVVYVDADTGWCTWIIVMTARVSSHLDRSELSVMPRHGKRSRITGLH